MVSPLSQGRTAAGSFREGDTTVVLNGDALNALFGSEDGPVAKALVKLGLRVEREAKHLCPVDTGRLRASIASRLERDGESFAAIVGTNVSYGVHVEAGTARMTAQPFLVPAAMTITGRAAQAETRNVGGGS